jgi:hypothetical protein
MNTDPFTYNKPTRVHKFARLESLMMKRRAVLPTHVVFDALVCMSRHYSQEQQGIFMIYGIETYVYGLPIKTGEMLSL